MSDSLSTILVIIAVVLIMFFVPFVFITNQNDTITTNEIKMHTSTFVNTVAKEGKITRR